MVKCKQCQKKFKEKAMQELITRKGKFCSKCGRKIFIELIENGGEYDPKDEIKKGGDK